MSDEGQAPKELRDRLAAVEAELKAERDQNAMLQAQQRGSQAEGIFRQLGLPTQQVELFLNANQGEPTPESVTQFAQKYGLAPIQHVPPPPQQAPATQAHHPNQVTPQTNYMGQAGHTGVTAGQPEQVNFLNFKRKLENEGQAAVEAQLEAGTLRTEGQRDGYEFLRDNQLDRMMEWSPGDNRIG